MSFIRSGSNPEGLYVFFDGKNIEFCVRDNPIKTMPPSTFYGIMNKYIEDGIYAHSPEHLEFEGATLIYDQFSQYSEHFKWRLCHDAWGPNFHLEMWEVTLESLARAAQLSNKKGTE